MSIVSARRPALSLVVALLAGGALMSGGADRTGPRPPSRLPAAQAWPAAQRAEVPESLPDGPLFQPASFLDANTAIGTAPSPDARSLRLVLRRAGGGVRTLRVRPAAGNPVFDNVTASGDTLLWTETADDQATEIWTMKPDSGRPAYRLTFETANPLFYGNQYDMVVAGDRVYWAAAPDGDETTQIRSVPLTGGAVRVRTERGRWALSAWPWLSDDAGQSTGTTMLRDMSTGQDVVVHATEKGLSACTPVWCRVSVLDDNGPVRLELMHPDGSGRRTIAAGAVRAAVADVAVLDRFEILSEPGPASDLTGTAGLLVYDISTRNTVDVSAAAQAVFVRNGILWWSTGNQDTTTWHSLDLRTA